MWVNLITMEEIFKTVSMYLATGVEFAAALIIGYAAVEAAFYSVILIIKRDNLQSHKEDIRLHLGRWLALSLEFLLAADILRTAVAPTWNEIGQLAAIVIIRTVLNYFLQKDIDAAEARRGNQQPRLSSDDNI